MAIDENIESKEEKKRRGKSIYTKKKPCMVVCGLTKQLFVLIAFMASFAMLMVFADKGAELSVTDNY